MSNIIFSKVIDNINTSSNLVNEFMNNKEKYFANLYSTINEIPNSNILTYFFIILITYSIFKNIDIKLNNIFVFLVSITIIYILMQKDYANFNTFIGNNNNKLKFLNSFLTSDGKTSKGSYQNSLNISSNTSTQSYLYYDSYIVEVMYNLKEYINLNITSYSNCIKAVNSLLKISYMSDQLSHNLLENFHSMIRLKKEALNFLTTIVYRLPVGYYTYEKFNNAIRTLHILLNSHINKAVEIFKNKVRKDKNIFIPLDSFDIYNKPYNNDTKTKDYNPSFNIY